MILAHHCILGFYGFWLPNDPRGSGSDYVANWELFRYGPATKTSERRSVAHDEHDYKLRLAAKKSLQHPPVDLTGAQAVAVAQGFRRAAAEAGYRFHALAILPDHVHAVIGWHPRDIRLIVGHLRAKATRALRDLGHPPFSRGARTALNSPSATDSAPGMIAPQDPSKKEASALRATRLKEQGSVPVWGDHGWNVELDEPESVARAIAYTEANPEKEGKPRQQWSVVAPFDVEKVALDRAVAQRDRIPLYKKRRVGGAALRSHQERLRRDAEFEQYLRSKPDPEDCF